jgi:D-glycero-alpha-D-manno-heptose-7-phosphate kinase
MIITQAPFRMSFFGGGTDYQPFFEEYGGSVLSATFDKYVYAIIRTCPPFFDYHTQIKYAKTESVRKTEELEHPLVRNCMLYTGNHNLSISYEADLPARSGLGSSSSFANALLLGMYSMQGRYTEKRKLAEDSIYVERVLCNEAGGWQDQIASAYGGFNRINFDSSSFDVVPVVMSKSRRLELERSIFMVYTWTQRISGQIAKEQTAVIKAKSKVSELLTMKQYVCEAERILMSDCKLSEFGKLLDHAWKLKRGLTSKISTELIDELYARAIHAGAYGGKLMGAGGGGFMLLVADPDAHVRIRKALSGLIHIPFSFETLGTRVLYHSTEEYD